MSQPRYQLTLRPLPDRSDPDGIRRLRRGLKHLLRSCRLRCEKAVQIHEDGTTLTGRDWVFPQDYQTEEVERHDLPSLKGMTDTELPTLERTV